LASGFIRLRPDFHAFFRVEGNAGLSIGPSPAWAGENEAVYVGMPLEKERVDSHVLRSDLLAAPTDQDQLFFSFPERELDLIHGSGQLLSPFAGEVQPSFQSCIRDQAGIDLHDFL
jgi:hypothetical protein